MASFEPKKIDLSQINNGQRYVLGETPEPEDFNATLEASAYAQKVSEDSETVAKSAEKKIDVAIKSIDQYKSETTNTVNELSMQIGDRQGTTIRQKGVPLANIDIEEDIQEQLNTLKYDVIYDYSSDDPEINLGYPNCISGNKAIRKDLSKYKRLKFYIKFTAVVQCITEADIFYNQTNTVTPLYRITDIVRTEADAGSRYCFLIEIPTDRSQFTMTKIGYYNNSNIWQDRTNVQFDKEYCIYRVEGFAE